jgi:hypothetical protein
MAELVEREVRLATQPPLAVEGVLLEETADRLAAREEIALGRVARAAIRGEDRRLAGRRQVLAREEQRTLAQRHAARGVHEIRQDQESVPRVCALLSRRKVCAHGPPATAPMRRV